MVPFIADKSKWTLPKDVMFFEYWPVRHASLVFAGLAYREPKYIELWKRLPADPVMTEIQRNMPVRVPVALDRLRRVARRPASGVANATTSQIVSVHAPFCTGPRADEHDPVEVIAP